jgi:hypothetical protein
MKIRPVKHKTPKFFGYKDERWATFNGSGRTRTHRDSYGHHSAYPDGRSKQEKEQAAINAEHKESLGDNIS